MKKLIIIIISLLFSFLSIKNTNAWLESYTKYYSSGSYNILYQDNNLTWFASTKAYLWNRDFQKTLYYEFLIWTNYNVFYVSEIAPTSTIRSFYFKRSNTMTSSYIPCNAFISSVDNSGVTHNYCTSTNNNFSATYMDFEIFKSNFYCSGENEILKSTNNVLSCEVIWVKTVDFIDNIKKINQNKSLYNDFLINTTFYILFWVFIFWLLIFILFLPLYMAKKTVYNIKNKQWKN